MKIINNTQSIPKMKRQIYFIQSLYSTLAYVKPTINRILVGMKNCNNPYIAKNTRNKSAIPALPNPAVKYEPNRYPL